MLSPERQSARMSEIKKLGIYGAEHSKCNHLMTLGFKGLKTIGRCRLSVAKRQSHKAADMQLETDQQWRYQQTKNITQITELSTRNNLRIT